MERQLEEFLEDVKSKGAARFVEENPHPFLFRQVDVVLEEDATAPTEEELTRKTKRIERMLGQDSGYVLSMVGARRTLDVAEGKLSRARAVRRERRVLPWTRKGKPFTEGAIAILGTLEKCHVSLPAELDAHLAERHAAIERGADLDEWLVRDLGSEWGTYVSGERLPAEERVPLPEAALLRFGPRLAYRFFTPSGFFHYLHFCLRLDAASKAE
jgi:hypothetical protein